MCIHGCPAADLRSSPALLLTTSTPAALPLQTTLCGGAKPIRRCCAAPLPGALPPWPGAHRGHAAAAGGAAQVGGRGEECMPA
jgi:hypothetical protein